MHTNSIHKYYTFFSLLIIDQTPDRREWENRLPNCTLQQQQKKRIKSRRIRKKEKKKKRKKEVNSSSTETFFGVRVTKPCLVGPEGIKLV